MTAGAFIPGDMVATGPALMTWAIDALIASTLLMIAVLLVRGPVRKAFGPQIAYALWALPVLRLVLPPMPEGWRLADAPIARAGETISTYVTASATNAATEMPLAGPMSGPAAGIDTASVTYPSLGAVVAAVWILGALGLLLWHLVRHRQFCGRMLDGADRLDDRQGVRVISTAAAPGPLAFGIVRRYVAFPRDFADRYDADECELALAHEIGHHQRGDLFANWIALIVLALHWFNPVAWHAFRRFRADQELANDARVLAGRSAVDRHIYACAIVKAAHGGAVSAACHLHTITDLKGRLRMLTTSRISRRRIATGAASVVVLGVAGLALTASGTDAAAAIRADVQARVAPAAPAAPPAPPAAASMAAPVAPVTRSAPVAPVAPAAPAWRGTKVTTITMRDGETPRTQVVRTTSGDADTAQASVPYVVERACIDGRDGPRQRYVIDGVVNGAKGKVRKLIICTNRIDQAAADGAAAVVHSREIEAQAFASALSSLKLARSTIERSTDISEDQKREALAGIDQGLAEVEADKARRD